MEVLDPLGFAAFALGLLALFVQRAAPLLGLLVRGRRGGVPPSLLLEQPAPGVAHIREHRLKVTI